MKSKLMSLIFLWVLLSCGKEKEDTNTSTAGQEFETFELIRSNFNTTLKVPSEFKPFEQVDLFPKVDGYIEKLLVDRGDEVEKGQVLAIINAPEIKAKLASAQAEFQSKKAEELAEQSTFLAAKDDWERFQQTAKTEGAISASQLFKKEQQFIRDSSRYEAAKMSAKAAESFLKAAEEMSNYLVLKSPFKGRITQRNFHSGAYVSAQQKRPLLRLSTVSHLRMEFLVPEQFASYVNEEDSLRVSSYKIKQSNKNLKISRRSGELDPQLRGEYFEADYQTDSTGFKSGNFVEIEVPIHMKSVFVVDESDVKTTLEDRYIEILDEKESLQKISVDKGLTSKGKVIIYGDLKEGMRVVKQ